ANITSRPWRTQPPLSVAATRSAPPACMELTKKRIFIQVALSVISWIPATPAPSIRSINGYSNRVARTRVPAIYAGSAQHGTGRRHASGPAPASFAPIHAKDPAATGPTAPKSLSWGARSVHAARGDTTLGATAICPALHALDTPWASPARTHRHGDPTWEREFRGWPPSPRDPPSPGCRRADRSAHPAGSSTERCHPTPVHRRHPTALGRR